MVQSKEQAWTAARDKFVEHLDRATEIVRAWPEWKRNLLGRNELDTGGESILDNSDCKEARPSPRL